MRVLDGEAKTLTKRKAWPTVECRTEVETAALAGCPTGTRLDVIVDFRSFTGLAPKAPETGDTDLAERA